jgi:hypothetical protein
LLPKLHKAAQAKSAFQTSATAKKHIEAAGSACNFNVRGIQNIKRQIRLPKETDLPFFLVEISGIEPLTS